MKFLRFWSHLFFTLVTCVLLLVFVLRVFAPGNAETAFLFRFVHPAQPWLDACANVLMVPVVWLLQWLLPHLPAAVLKWFPIGAAAPLLKHWAHGLLLIPPVAKSALGAQVRHAPYATLFPGVLDWRILLTILFWAQVENVVTGFFSLMEKVAYRTQLRYRDAKLLHQLRQDEEAQPGQWLPSETHSLSLEPSPLPPVLPNARPDYLPEAAPHMDPLTQVFTQYFFMQRLRWEMEQAQAMGQCLALLIVDVDDLAQINERYGTQHGDAVLVWVAQTVTALLPSPERSMACRYNGGGFAMLLMDAQPDEAERIAYALCDQLVASGSDIPISVSVGGFSAYFIPENASSELTPDAFLARADAQLYVSKRSGKNRVSLASLA